MSGVETKEKPFGSATTNTTKGSVVDAHVVLNEELLLLNAQDSTLIVVPKEGVKAFHEEANQMQSLVHKLNHSRNEVLELEEKLAVEAAKRPNDPGQINALGQQVKKAKKEYEAVYAELRKELGSGGYLSPGGGGKLMELLPLAKRTKDGHVKDWARKWTYVRSDKVKNHIRSYKFNKDDAEQKKSFLRDGKIDKGELKKQFSELEPKLKAEWKAGVNGFIFPNLQEWAESLNIKADEKKPVKFSAEVQLFRYFAGCGAAAEWNPKGGKIGANINGKAELMLAYGECKAEGFLPHAEGVALSITGIKSGKEFLIGAIRLAGEAKLVGSAGASAAAELSVEVDYSKLTSPGIKGGRRPANAAPMGSKEKLEEVAKESGLNAGADAFAGVKASGEIKGSLQYRNPEKGDKFADMAAIAPKVEVEWGAGAAAALKVTYEKGKFRMRAKAGVCFGPGAKGEVGLEVDAIRLAVFMEWVFHALLNAEFEFLQILAKEAFDAITQLQVMMVSGVENAYHAIEREWDAFEASLEKEERRVALMNAILRNPATLRICTPEAHGILLWQMTRHDWKTDTLYVHANSEGFNFLGHRKSAVLQICRWAQCKSQLHNMVQHLSPTGAKGQFPDNWQAIKRFMDWHGGDYGDRLDDLYLALPYEPARGYPVAMNDSSRFKSQSMMGGSPTYLAMLGGSTVPNNLA